jgi:hypothetical protein
MKGGAPVIGVQDLASEPDPGSLGLERWALPGSLVDRTCIVGYVCHEGSNPIIDPVREFWHSCTVRHAAVGQVGLDARSE